MPFRVMTFNLLYDGATSWAGKWSDRLPLCLDVIRSRAPDVAGLQEATSKQIEDLCRGLQEYRVLPGPPSDGSRPLLRRATPCEHSAILVRRDRVEVLDEDAFWISHRPDRSGSLLPGTWLPRVVHRATLRMGEGREIAFFCVHADMTPWTWHTSLRILRQRLDRACTGIPQVAVGDFNVPPGSSAWKRLLGGAASFRDAWLDADARVGPEGTYHGGKGCARWPGRIDRILVRPYVAVLCAETVTDHCGTTYPSDHFPLLATVDLVP